jgi:hypothetical protein
MRIFNLIALASALLLSACVFESEAPLVPPADYATPLAPGDYVMFQREDSGEWTKDSDNTLTLADQTYTITNSDGPMRFTLYRVSPKIFLVQVSEKPDEGAYALLEPTDTGAEITTLACKSLSTEERARFHLAPSSETRCVFTTLDDLVTAALHLKGRGETPSLRLERQEPKTTPTVSPSP